VGKKKKQHTPGSFQTVGGQEKKGEKKGTQEQREGEAEQVRTWVKSPLPYRSQGEIRSGGKKKIPFSMGRVEKRQSITEKKGGRRAECRRERKKRPPEAYQHRRGGAEKKLLPGCDN